MPNTTNLNNNNNIANNISNSNMNYKMKKNNILNLNRNQPSDNITDLNHNFQGENINNISSSNNNFPTKNFAEDEKSVASNFFDTQTPDENFTNNSIKANLNSHRSGNISKNKALSTQNYFNKEFDEDNNIINKNLNLTNKVWPKSRTFLSIISKMFNENYINDHQRGILKDMIMDHNPQLYNILEEYEIDGDSKKMYDNIIVLANSFEKKFIK